MFGAGLYFKCDVARDCYQYSDACSEYKGHEGLGRCQWARGCQFSAGMDGFETVDITLCSNPVVKKALAQRIIGGSL